MKSLSSATADSAGLDETEDALSVEFRRGSTFGFGTFFAYSMAYTSTFTLLVNVMHCLANVLLLLLLLLLPLLPPLTLPLCVCQLLFN